MRCFFLVILLQHCIITSSVDPTTGTDLLSAKVPTKLGDLSHEPPIHHVMFPEIKASVNDFKAEFQADWQGATESRKLSSALSNEIRHPEASASDTLRKSHRQMSGKECKEFRKNISKPYKRNGMLDASAYKKYPQGQATRGQNDSNRSCQSFPQYLHEHPVAMNGPLAMIPSGHLHYASTAPIPQPEGWVPFFSNYEDAVEWLKFGSHYGNFHTLPLQPLWEPSRLLPGRPFSAHETYPPIYPHTTNLHQYNGHGRADHGRVTSNWAQRSLRTPPLMTAKQDMSQTKLSAKSDNTAENSALQPIQELVKPQDDELQTKILCSNVVDPRKSSSETLTDTDPSYYSVDDMNPAAKPISKDQEFEKHGAKTAMSPTQQSLDQISSKASYKSIALTGFKSKTFSNSKPGTSIEKTLQISSQTPSSERSHANKALSKSTSVPKPVDPLVKAAQLPTEHTYLELKMNQNNVSDQRGDIKLDVLKGEKVPQNLGSVQSFTNKGSKVELLQVSDSFIQNSKKLTSSEWTMVKKKNNAVQNSSSTVNILLDSPPSEKTDTSKGFIDIQRTLAVDTKAFDGLRDSVFEPLRHHTSSGAQEELIAEPNNVDMQGPNSDNTYSKESAPVNSPKVVYKEPIPSKDRSNIKMTVQKPERSRRKKIKKQPKAVNSINAANLEMIIDVSAHQNDSPMSGDPIRGESFETSLKLLISNFLQLDNIEKKVQISLTKEDFQKLLLAQDDVVSCGIFPEVFGKKWREAISSLAQGSKNPLELLRRIHSLEAQYSQKAIVMRWALYKSKLSPQAHDACLLLKMAQEWPTFYDVDYIYLATCKAKLEALDNNEAQSILQLILKRNLDSRLSTLYLMAKMRKKIFTELELVSLLKSGGSIPVLLQICNLLELSNPDLNWKTFTKEQILEKLKGLKRIMEGNFDMDKNTELDVDDDVWVASNTRAFILNSQLSKTFEKQLKTLAKLADRLLPHKTAKEWMPGQAHFNWANQNIGEGEALLASHFGLDMSSLAVLKCLIELHNRRPSRGMKNVIFWPGEAPDTMKQQIDLFAEFYKFQGLKLLSK
ncbi:hypothetical protein DFH28DRAFT_537957 [Melampsora americana]|nr:hypothetical protein DFH28DRAFT_537957 [Melampsora americana]